MSGTSALLGHPNESPGQNPKKSKDEEDLRERSTKKIKSQNQDEVGNRSYRDMMLCVEKVRRWRRVVMLRRLKVKERNKAV
ncbi:hypothetical protein TSUD_107530 [Trifolium subterraneum]|uniref:Uncharacterized protein n=1 Tax=Trifolium subterraneum TaxID=3900 RepID=A0A2Z6NN54_TRISU|nr:hypothetical protein TSUD_107530 [Trifolium subterraneum]